MKRLVNIAFRNLFRNQRRSILTVFICALAVLMMMVSNSFLEGLSENLLNESIKYSGHVRITSPNYEIEERTMALSENIDQYDSVAKAIAKLKNEGGPVTTYYGKLRFGTVVYKGDTSRECVGTGVEKAELDRLGVKKRVYRGRILDLDQKDEILVGKELAKTLKLAIGDQVTLLTRTLNGSNGALNFKVVGFYDLENELLNKLFYISLPAAQNLLDMDGRVTELLVFTTNTKETGTLMAQLSGLKQTKPLLLRRWDQIGMGPMFMMSFNMILGAIQLIFIILAGLGIINTMLMTVFERRGEIGVLKALGMYDREIMALFTLEGGLLGVFGSILGLIVGGLVTFGFSKGITLVGSNANQLSNMISNVVYGSFNIGLFIKGLTLGIVTATGASFLPVRSGVRLKPTEALRQ